MSTEDSAPAAAARRPKTNATSSEPELKLLDMALQEQQKARDTFLRDLKLALLLILGFQFLILLRFVRLTENARANNERIATLTAQQRVLGDVRSGLEQLRSALAQGEAGLGKQLAAGPEHLHGQMQQLDAAVKLISSRSSEPKPNNMAFQGPMQASPQGMLSTLSPEQMRQMKEAYAAENIDSLRRLLTPLVRAEILDPYFVGLNSDARALIVRPFEAKRGKLTDIIRKESGVLATLNLAPDAILEEIDAMQARVNKLHFSAPESDQWWTSTGGKGQVFNGLASDTDKMIGSLSQQLAKLSASTSVIDDRIKKLLQESETKHDQLAEQMRELQAQSDQIRGFLADVAKPFQLMTVQVQDAVIYSPIVVAVIWGYLTFEYLVLSSRVKQLVSAYRVLGFPESSLKIYFAGVPGSTAVSAIASSVLFALPLVVSMWSVSRIHASQVLRQTAPARAYIFAETVLFICFGVLVVALLRCYLALKQSQPQ